MAKKTKKPAVKGAKKAPAKARAQPKAASTSRIREPKPRTTISKPAPRTQTAPPARQSSKPETQTARPKTPNTMSRTSSRTHLERSGVQNEPEKSGPVEITPEIRRLWIRMRQAWVVSYDAFNNSVAVLDKRQAEMMYDVVRRSLYKDNHAEVLREHPELKPLLQTDDDRLCMHDIYRRLSYRLNREEPLPPDKRAYRGMKGAIGRNLPDLEV